MSGGYSGCSSSTGTEGVKYLDVMNKEKQNKQIPGTKEFDPNRSPIDLVTIDELERLIEENWSKCVRIGVGKMILDLPINVGTWKSIDGNESAVTNRVTIHRSRTGYHAVPARPKKGGK